MFTGPEYEHLNIILKAFLWAEGHFVACPSGSRNNLKTSNYGGLLSLCESVLLNLCKQRKLFWNKLDTLSKNYKKDELLSWNWPVRDGCWKSPVLILPTHSSSTAHLHRFFTKCFSYSSLHHDSYRGSIIPSLHLFHEPVSMFKILLDFSSGLIYPVQDISHAHLFLRFQQGGSKRLPSFSRKNSHGKHKSWQRGFCVVQKPWFIIPFLEL